jgi:hypothetical protein
MTEEEAKTKWCPPTAASSIDGDTHAGDCIGSRCMAWRWLHKAGKDENDQPNYYAGPWQGYCGLAGRP